MTNPARIQAVGRQRASDLAAAVGGVVLGRSRVVAYQAEAVATSAVVAGGNGGGPGPAGTDLGAMPLVWVNGSRVTSGETVDLSDMLVPAATVQVVAPGGATVTTPGGVYRRTGVFQFSVRLVRGVSQFIAVESDGNTVSFSLLARTLTVAPTATPSSGDIPLVVSFAAHADGNPPYTYAWDFGDGAASTDANPTHEYADEGVFAASVTVTDTIGLVASGAVTVSPAYSSLPVEYMFGALGARTGGSDCAWLTSADGETWTKINPQPSDNLGSDFPTNVAWVGTRAYVATSDARGRVRRYDSPHVSGFSDHAAMTILPTWNTATTPHKSGDGAGYRATDGGIGSANTPDDMQLFVPWHAEGVLLGGAFYLGAVNMGQLWEFDPETMTGTPVWCYNTNNEGASTAGGIQPFVTTAGAFAFLYPNSIDEAKAGFLFAAHKGEWAPFSTNIGALLAAYTEGFWESGTPPMACSDDGAHWIFLVRRHYTNPDSYQVLYSNDSAVTWAAGDEITVTTGHGFRFGRGSVAWDPVREAFIGFAAWCPATYPTTGEMRCYQLGTDGTATLLAAREIEIPVSDSAPQRVQAATSRRRRETLGLLTRVMYGINRCVVSPCRVPWGEAPEWLAEDAHLPSTAWEYSYISCQSSAIGTAPVIAPAPAKLYLTGWNYYNWPSDMPTLTVNGVNVPFSDHPGGVGYYQLTFDTAEYGVWEFSRPNYQSETIQFSLLAYKPFEYRQDGGSWVSVSVSGNQTALLTVGPGHSLETRPA